MCSSDLDLPAERALLENIDASLRLLENLTDSDRRLVREVLNTITSGQELDLRRFAGASADKVISLLTDEEVENFDKAILNSLKQRLGAELRQ